MHSWSRGRQTLPNCPEKCGNVILEYPFGFSPGCHYAEDPTFKLSCFENKTLFFGRREVVSISHSNQLRVLFPSSVVCYGSQGEIRTNLFTQESLGNLRLSENNMLTAVGCNTFAFLTTSGVRNYSAACISVCDSPLVENRICNGEGCCQNLVPAGGSHFFIKSYPFSNVTLTTKTSVNLSTSHCIHAFLVKNGKFKFNGVEDLKNVKNIINFPVVLDWSIGDKNCKEAGILCGENSKCYNSTDRTGYVCKCKGGYDGNPYLLKGCQGTSYYLLFLLSSLSIVHCFPSYIYCCIFAFFFFGPDIDECTTSNTIHKHKCPEGSNCVNTDGHFSCKCPSGNHIIDDKCTPKGKPEYFEWTQIFLGKLSSLGGFFLFQNNSL